MFTNVVKTSVSHDADNLEILPLRLRRDIEVLADGITSRKELLCKVHAYQCYARRVLVVLPVETSAPQQADSDSLEESRHDHFKVRLHLCIGSANANPFGPLPNVPQAGMDHSGRHYSRQTRNTVVQLAVIIQLIQVFVAVRSWKKTEIEHPVRAKSGVDCTQFFECTNEKPGAHEENQ